MLTKSTLPENEPLARENCVDSTQDSPERVNETFSTVINVEHAAMISSWIGNQPQSYSLTNNPYEFQLILHGSKDGFSLRTYWNISWIKKIVGDMKTNKSFIFSFKDGSIQNSILSRVKNENCALHFQIANFMKNLLEPILTIKGWSRTSKKGLGPQGMVLDLKKWSWTSKEDLGPQRMVLDLSE
ncbi:hypothetical protein Glove_168g262 [Diversispora epigaea]|uniref:TLDc domain-containing protein n=1 Tax=Diversispora epigaea TaxID=1348612 RepID=A0A397IT31_9GLOM|nr:hypothetical protein Glove_168g262 [Diversispora epigaea]